MIFTSPSVSPRILRPAVSAERILLDDDVVTGLARRGLRQTGERDLGVAVDAPRDPRVVDRDDRLGEHALHRDDPFGESDVSELRGVHHVADRPDTGLAGALELVGDHETPVVDHDGGARFDAAARCRDGGRPRRRPSRRRATGRLRS